MSEHKDKCLRCGQCCHYPIQGILTPCRFLKKLPDGKTRCGVYKTRIGRVMFNINNVTYVICGDRKDSRFNYPGCPYNIRKEILCQNPNPL
jgi:hypothetical protein